MCPGQVGGAFDGAGIVVAVGGAYADTADAAFCTGLGDDMVEGFCKLCDEGLNGGVVV